MQRRATAEGETIGIDLGDKLSRYRILDEAGVVLEEGSFRNQAASIEKHFGGDRGGRMAITPLVSMSYRDLWEMYRLQDEAPRQ